MQLTWKKLYIPEWIRDQAVTWHNLPSEASSVSCQRRCRRCSCSLPAITGFGSSASGGRWTSEAWRLRHFHVPTLRDTKKTTVSPDGARFWREIRLFPGTQILFLTGHLRSWCRFEETFIRQQPRVPNRDSKTPCWVLSRRRLAGRLMCASVSDCLPMPSTCQRACHTELACLYRNQEVDCDGRIRSRCIWQSSRWRIAREAAEKHRHERQRGLPLDSGSRCSARMPLWRQENRPLLPEGIRIRFAALVQRHLKRSRIRFLNGVIGDEDPRYRLISGPRFAYLERFLELPLCL